GNRSNEVGFLIGTRYDHLVRRTRQPAGTVDDFSPNRPKSAEIRPTTGLESARLGCGAPGVPNNVVVFCPLRGGHVVSSRESSPRTSVNGESWYGGLCL